MEHIECDVLVVGSGAAGLTTAFTAADSGLNVIVVEKEPFFGGTTAYSAGVIWIPENSLAKREGVPDSAADAATYLKSEAGEFFNEPKVNAFLEQAPKMLDYLLEQSHVRYQLIPNWADYHPLAPGAAQGGRSLLPEPFDGRKLGRDFLRLRVPLATMMLFGGMSVSRSDIPHLFNATRSVRSGIHVLGMLARYAKDRLSWPRGTAIANGNALIGRLALSLFEKKVPIWTSAPVVELSEEDGRITGAVVKRDGVIVKVRARKGVVLATGGFPRNKEWRERYYSHVAQGKNHVSLAPQGNTGDGAAMAMKLGAAMSQGVSNPAAWAPVSTLRNADGSSTPYPHFIDRCKPGFIAVDKRGKRFANEADSYHDFVPAMVKACEGDERVEAFLICDHPTIRRYGMGVVPPSPMPIRRFIDQGYLLRGNSVSDLARQLGVDAQGLQDTVTRYNSFAREGTDPDFGKGSNVYNHFGGDPSCKPNPNLAPIESGPFYAVRLEPSDLGTFQGLDTDEHARVLRHSDSHPIPGLYAVGNDMNSVMGGAYPGAGITIGPAMTFGYIAAKHLAS